MGKESMAWLILFLPLAAAGIIALFTRKWPHVSARLSIAAVVASFLLTLGFASAWKVPFETSAPWINVGNFNVEMGLVIDRLAWVMLLIVTGVGGTWKAIRVARDFLRA
jgi:NADH:ubiquinone oxidoreductase subunit 5 (subunit L)/multisubunit Na+/H+ antiporter MnhA subunit